MTVDEAIKYVESAWVPGAAPTILAAEVRRLREVLDESETTVQVWWHSYKQAEAERDRYREERDRYREALEILASIWFYGGFVAETYYETKLQRIMESIGLWPTTEVKILELLALRGGEE